MLLVCWMKYIHTYHLLGICRQPYVLRPLSPEQKSLNSALGHHLLCRRSLLNPYYEEPKRHSNPLNQIGTSPQRNKKGGTYRVRALKENRWPRNTSAPYSAVNETNFDFWWSTYGLEGSGRVHMHIRIVPLGPTRVYMYSIESMPFSQTPHNNSK
jgi:hypothetical protein